MELLQLFFFILIIVYCTYIIIYEKRSINSKLIENALWLSKYKTKVSTEKGFDEYIKKETNKHRKEYQIPKIKFKSKIKKHTFNDMEYFVFEGKKKAKRIFFLHGGSYIQNPLLFHWLFLDELESKTGYEIVMPIYPKAPEYHYKDAYKKVIDLYTHLYGKEEKETIIIGDSAGGGFSLGLSMKLRNEDLKGPNKIILLSPWLDITMKNNEIAKYENVDPQLSKNALIKAGKLWKNNSRNNYLLSPILGDFKNLGKIYLFIGTHEILLPDAKKLVKLAKKQNTIIEYYEYDKMNHVFPMHPIPEAKKAKAQIKEIISK